jgi:hypothetical protein
MKNQLERVVLVCAISAAPFLATLGRAQEIKEKPPMYSYVSNWAIPRAQWGEMEKANVANRKVLDKAMASGTIVAYGDDTNLVHQPDGDTHDDWWSAMSMAGVLNVLEQFYQSGSATTPVLTTATKHSDGIYVSRYYNWHSGSLKNGYTHFSEYKLTKDAPADAVETLSKSLIAPLLEKMLADGAIQEYEVDTQAIHTDAPEMFFIVYIASSADGLDKVNAGLRDTLKSNPLAGPAFGSMTESKAHRDELARTNAVYK